MPEIKSQTGSDFTQEINNNKSTPVLRKAKKLGNFYGRWKQGMSKSTHDLTIATENNRNSINDDTARTSQRITQTENSRILDRELVYRFIIPLYGYLGQVVPD